MKLTDLIVSPKSLGDKLWLVDVSPAYEYKDNKRTDTVLGYRYSVALPEKGLDKVDVIPCGGKCNRNSYRESEALTHWKPDLTTLLSGKSYIAFLRPISAWRTR